jgi:RNA recognition motif-containing protein
MVKALSLNQSLFMDKHIRVDKVKAGQDEDAKNDDDFNTTVFVGNLPFVVSEEEVRAHFSKFGTIQNVRLVREPKTFIGKGIGFVMFSNEKELRAAMTDGTKFKGRELRLKKATDPKKREKKANRKEAALVARKEVRRLKQKADKGEGSDSEDLKGLGKRLQDVSDDSEDEPQMPGKMPKVVDLSGNGDKEKLMKQLGQTTKDERELKIQNVISFNQRKR